ncbi:MAG: BamA/TamA family outer membrane protein [Candidatus Zixiibacteriota bacterium]|nr:MAG: BamA/TamA family outer membrane protein [candidate division Zixibacteria bacterium]
MLTKYVLRAIIGIVCLFAGVTASAVEYKEYKRTRLEKEYFEISYDRTEVRITTFEDDDTYTSVYPRSSLEADEGKIYSDGRLLFDEKGLVVDEQYFYYDDIVDSRIMSEEKVVTITFYTRKPSPSQTTKFKRGNLVVAGEPLTVKEDDFVRGMVLAVGSDVDVLGEVNRDVISILGDVYIGPDAVARGDVAAVDGRIDVASDASVYGEVYDVDRRNIRLRLRFSRGLRDWDFLNNLTYDRVDGLGLNLGVQYQDHDSLLPTFMVQMGYAFNSERWRYETGLEQTILRDPAVAAGGRIYRRLATDDDWLIGEDENTAFALLATEDFRDYYQAEGGNLYVKVRPRHDIDIESGYRLEETRWLDARRHLWSLFGGSKLFPENFNTVNDAFRAASIAEIDTTNIGVLYASASWDTRDKADPFDRSAWYATVDLEWSHDSFSSDFDYRRYVIGVRRYQKINRRAALITRGVYGGSDGYLPMYKRFFLGGLGTLRGYDHKEFMGTRFWLANTEYRINFPRIEAAISIFWDVGQIANEHKLDGSIDIKNNLGLALYLEDDFKVSLAKRLDRSFDDNPIFYVRLDHIF